MAYTIEVTCEAEPLRNGGTMIVSAVQVTDDHTGTVKSERLRGTRQALFEAGASRDDITHAVARQHADDTSTVARRLATLLATDS